MDTSSFDLLYVTEENLKQSQPGGGESLVIWEGCCDINWKIRSTSYTFQEKYYLYSMNAVSILSNMLPSDHGKMERIKMFSSLKYIFSTCGLSDTECLFGFDVHLLQI
jgi:hypothetical protein